ncbi:START domain-containing protein [Chitinophaga defluvii]|uniref:START domain-containing protein n=1 Tax=Chitinophaga defluvii TaxID=3163343 RepID=A0ABV2T349_9BACT
MKKRFIFLLLQLMIASWLYAAQSAGDFKLVKQDEVISLYERWIPGAGGGQVRQIKAIFLVQSDVAAVARLLTNQAMGTNWNTNAKVYQVLLSGVADNWITYTRYGIPWPFGDQDCCLSYHLYKDPERNRTGEITFESTLHNKFPVSYDVARITGTRGKWLMEDEGDGHMKITYMITTDRSKKVPRWVSDPIIRNNLFSTMTTFRNILENHRL